MYPGVPLQLWRGGGSEQRGHCARPAEVLLLPRVRAHTRAVASAAHCNQARLLLSVASIHSALFILTNALFLLATICQCKVLESILVAKHIQVLSEYFLQLLLLLPGHLHAAATVSRVSSDYADLVPVARG